MNNSINLFPSLNDNILNKIRFQHRKFEFFYTDKEDNEYPLEAEPLGVEANINGIKDSQGIWTQDDYNLCFRKKYLLRSFACLFGKNGIACSDAKLGIAIEWTSSDSHQRGMIKVGEFTVDETEMNKEVEMHFGKAQLRGKVDFTTVMYIAEAGNPKEDELHLANTNGYIMGILDNYSIKLDGNSSIFPIFEVSEPEQPLWYINCDWDSSISDKFSECVSINLNNAHKYFPYIDRKSTYFLPPLLNEIIASALVIIIEKTKSDSDEWEDIMNNNNLESGSIGEAIYYFNNTLGWDMSTPETISLCARKFLDKGL